MGCAPSQPVAAETTGNSHKVASHEGQASSSKPNGGAAAGKKHPPAAAAAGANSSSNNHNSNSSSNNISNNNNHASTAASGGPGQTDRGGGGGGKPAAAPPSAAAAAAPEAPPPEPAHPPPPSDPTPGPSTPPPPPPPAAAEPAAGEEGSPAPPIAEPADDAAAQRQDVEADAAGNNGEEDPSAPVTDGEVAALSVKLALAENAVFDVPFAMEQVGDDVEFLEEMKDSLVPLQEETHTFCLQGVLSGAWPVVFEKAHAFKGAVSNLGLNKLRTVAYALEQSGRTHNRIATGEAPASEAQYSVRENVVLVTLLQQEWEAFSKTG
ncbi:hypothetical protein DIPPA_24413 [Diplonema papillatum]|nr:hypothetical protein DIPPA_24413 [Diplonema papillatum]